MRHHNLQIHGFCVNAWGLTQIEILSNNVLYKKPYEKEIYDLIVCNYGPMT